MGASTTYLNTMITGSSGDGYQSLHSAATGTTGADEISGGSYAREAEAYSTAASGAKSNSAIITQNVPAITTVADVGHWSAATSGVFAIGVALSSSITFTSAGTLTFAVGADSISITDSQG